ncbi:hypothetical protein GM921_16620 [Pedobacter sp. LMG 31464]|uniref:Lipocalin-like domain-containing protein n=1 Tax=Pedobacter planticolens TaxID=2679964 RepID=A0A923E1T4_9SPHI|nr:hypothetical protein [Pedobacter planticolens]MBB2147130.1 hypothetical protein [Pedobacter planticolens]
MKFFSTLLLVSLYFSTANAQEISYQSVKGTWEYESPKKKSKLSYKFDVDNKFKSITERKGNEIQVDGTYEIYKNGNLDQLKLTSADKENSARTQILYHFIKFIGPDTLKMQRVNDKQTNWSRETRRNTMTFVRKKEKVKEEKPN